MPIARGENRMLRGNTGIKIDTAFKCPQPKADEELRR
jgi:hypothetical protein